MPMTLSTQFGLPVSARRAAWAGALGIATVAILASSRRKVFDSVMIGAFVIGFTTCVPLSIEAPGADGQS